jgi:hypothetical protein
VKIESIVQDVECILILERLFKVFTNFVEELDKTDLPMDLLHTLDLDGLHLLAILFVLVPI